mgnify:CR=1 FL=1
MKRSKNVLFIPFCLLAQGLRAEGVVKRYPAIITPILDLLEEYQVNVIQMPCPEIRYLGIKRMPMSKEKLDDVSYRELCKKQANEVVLQIMELIENGYRVLGILGVEYSPTCAVNYLFERRRLIKEPGIYIEELKRELENRGLSIPIIGVNIRGIKKTLNELRKILKQK